MVGVCGWRERRGLAARAPRHSGPARLAAAANIVVTAPESECSTTSLFCCLFLGLGIFRFFLLFLHFIVSYGVYVIYRKSYIVNTVS